MSIEVRKAEEKDLDEVVEMWYDLATDHEKMMEGYDLSENARENWKDFVEKGLERNGMCTFVAEDEEELLGFLNVIIRERLAIFKETEIGMILDVFVKEERRDEGVGSKLTERAERWIDEKGVNVAVITVSPENEGGVKFWDDRGYETYLLKKRVELS
ncbi:MAG: GNAT family N-acetyltransferase [Candidatus Thermoplasmatota archaeon]|nr:GNAT family N-acetyltransferase [Candidatus Thermoplasmatota archaeon]